VFCGDEGGCDSELYLYAHRECWLKWMAPDLIKQSPVPAWARGDGVNWTSGIVNTSACGSGGGVVPAPPPTPSPTPQSTPAAPVVTVPVPSPTSTPTPTPTAEPPPSPVPVPAPASATCLEYAVEIRGLCTGLLLGQEDTLSTQDAGACCEVISVGLRDHPLPLRAVKGGVKAISAFCLACNFESAWKAGVARVGQA
jgi:hypothetical protein